MNTDKYQKTLPFLKELSTYFMDFLETDFHKRRLPKRRIISKTNDNLLCGVNLIKYPAFYRKLLSSLFSVQFDTEKLSYIQKGAFKSNISKSLVDLINLHISRINKDKVERINQLIIQNAEEISILHKSNITKAINTHKDFCTKTIKDELISVFVDTIKEPLIDTEYIDENDLYGIEEDLADVVVNLVNENIGRNIRNLIADDSHKLKLSKYFEKNSITNALNEFFSEFQVGDLYLEIDELFRNKQILDKQEFYLNIFDIYFEKNKYPIFYIPLQIEKVEQDYKISFEQQLFINKKALEYIEQQYNEKENSQSHLTEFKERIIYLSNCADLNKLLITKLSDLQNFFSISNSFEYESQVSQSIKSRSITISNSLYLSLFDKADDSLVNDYEIILDAINNGSEDIISLFKNVIDGFFFEETKSINQSVDDEWDSAEITEKLVAQSPIPLNSEQRKILKGLNDPNCRYFVVQGPPGTGKSHTITAIIFEYLLKGMSVLVLSDKNEALDVVEDKITQTLNTIRKEESFQNPILRLGRSQNAYSQILANNNIEKIKQHYKVVKNRISSLDSQIQEKSEDLSLRLKNEIAEYGEIDIKQIREFYLLEKLFDEQGWPIEKTLITLYPNLGVELVELLSSIEKVNEIGFNSKIFLDLYELYGLEKPKKIDDLIEFVELTKSILIVFNQLKSENCLESIEKFGYDDYEKPHLLNKYHKDLLSLKWPIFGYFFNKSSVDSILSEINKEFPQLQVENLQENLDCFSRAIASSNRILEIQKSEFGEYELSLLKILIKIYRNKAVLDNLENAISSENELTYLNSVAIGQDTKALSEALNISSDLSMLIENKVSSINSDSFQYLVRYFTLSKELESKFSKIEAVNFDRETKSLEELVTTKMSFILDERVVNFYENNRTSAKVLKEIIRKKQQFPKEEFIKLKNAFPCIISSIRDYAEYIPLQQELFDLVIIDEASQVSIAQAFPALIRSKKVLVLGDQRQFSNVKANQARSNTNQDYLNRLREVFTNNISRNDSDFVKLSKFNIKTSILEFFEFISGFNTQLIKHFRGYKELISYSNKYFYQNSLQVMKIRAKPIDEVLKFTKVEHSIDEVIPNTNTNEIDEVINLLTSIYENKQKSSVGIITPHTNQQRLLIEKISNLEFKDYLYEELNLKIMTFDTCQGEERDLIIYSMVADEKSDHLWGVFIKDLNGIDLEEDGKIKAQRLNVGLSRAKETMHFVISKDIELFNGAIGEALKHYRSVLLEARKQKESTDVDKNSPMEAKLLDWFYQTKFYEELKDRIEILPQFELGKYLQQLDSEYSHPKYVVDFLLLVRDPQLKDKKIIIEYDGFQEHFTSIDEVDEYNYENYYTEEDVYRQKVLESYGYRFLRVNKFNLTDNPVISLSNRLFDIINGKRNTASFIDNIQDTISKLRNGDKKECSKCHEFRDTKDFQDTSLISGVGRICKQCKTLGNSSSTDSTVTDDSNCPLCGAKMVLRSGRYGKFLGCSKFPYCRGTRRI